MRILQLFNRYAYVGGEEIAVGQITEELSAVHELRTITFDSNEWARETSWPSRAKQFLSMAWNPESIGKFRKEIREFRPQIILIHNIMPVGSAALFLHLVRCGIPVIQFVHNFRPFSVNGYCWGDGKLLPQGLDKNFIPEILAGSWQNSRLKTAWYGLLIWLLHQAGVFKKIHGWIAISEFMRETFMRGGIESDRIRVISHSWQPRCSDEEIESANSANQEPAFLFLGRLTEEKGVGVLLDAWESFTKACPAGILRIAGDGPLKEQIELRCSAMDRAHYVGFQTGAAKSQLLHGCSALIVPSVWWEPLGLVLYEAYDHGKPVLAARSGGIVDHVVDGQSGWLHEPGDVEQLASHLLQAASSPVECRERGKAGRKLLLERSSRVWIDEFDAFVEHVVSNHLSSEPESGSPSFPEDASGQLHLIAYLADQNPGHDRSFGISRMSLIVLDSLRTSASVKIETIASRTSQQAPTGIGPARILPWGTRRKSVRLLTDHLHPLFARGESAPDLHYFPKGYLPLLSGLCRPSVVTIHDTIIQYDEDHYPDWRKPWEYAYWAMMLKHTLRHADRIMTVSESSRKQILAFMDRHQIPEKEITVTYEPCLYESVPQPRSPSKENYVIHLASCEPHKRTAHLIRWWHEAEKAEKKLPTLHLIGTVPEEVAPLLASSRSIVKRPFLEDAALQAAYLGARALILPSEIEGFGLPALEAYYLGTPVCFVKGTSVEEVLSVATERGGFRLDSPDSLFSALADVTAMSTDEIHQCGLKLREAYAASKVAERMMKVFLEVKAEMLKCGAHGDARR
jgi:glycosyltransferase involved in cell wall biosynthesis